MQILRRFVQSCFEEAHKDKRTSLAFPPLATGNWSSPPEEVAEIMVSVTFSFSKKYPKTTLKDVRFVICVHDCNKIPVGFG